MLINVNDMYYMLPDLLPRCLRD